MVGRDSRTGSQAGEQEEWQKTRHGGSLDRAGTPRQPVPGGDLARALGYKRRR